MLTICSGTIRCLEGIVEMANILNTEETYLKSSLISVILFATSMETFYTPYLAHITLPKKNSVKTDQTVPSRVV